MATKMTKAQKFALALTLAEVQAHPELVELFEKEIASLSNKNTSRKPTATQIANEGIKAEILEYMADGKAHTVSEIMKALPSLAGASNQKATSLVRSLSDQNGACPDSPLVREEVKGKAYFRLR